MNKKFLSILLSALTLLCISACGSSENANVTADTTNSNSMVKDTNTENTEAQAASGQERMDGKNNSYARISQEEAKAMMANDDGHVIVDVRRQDEYDAGHIPGAILIPNESITTEKPDALPDLNQIILIYCRSGNRSKQAAQKLSDMGYKNIYEFGGIIDWTGEVVTGETDGQGTTASEKEERTLLRAIVINMGEDIGISDSMYKSYYKESSADKGIQAVIGQGRFLINGLAIPANAAAFQRLPCCLKIKGVQTHFRGVHFTGRVCKSEKQDFKD